MSHSHHHFGRPSFHDAHARHGHGGPGHGPEHGPGPGFCDDGPPDRFMGRRGHRGGGRPEGGFGPQGRARRGEARFVLLDALKGGAMHGYEIIKSIEERSQGQYSPSPGTVYPTMQFLEDLGFVKANQDAERKVFTLTDLGRTELETHSAEIDEFWSRFSAPATSQATQAEISFLEEEIERLTRTVWTRLLSARDANNHEVIRKVRQAVERCQNEVRDIITAG